MAHDPIIGFLCKVDSFPSCMWEEK